MIQCVPEAISETRPVILVPVWRPLLPRSGARMHQTRQMLTRNDADKTKVWRLIWISVAVAVAFTCGYLMRVIFPTWELEPLYRAVRVLAPSPAAAGIAAVIAATIAATALGRQLAHNKLVEKDRDWWRAFEWAVDRALPKNTAERLLPFSHSVNTLTALHKSAANPVQEQACSGFLDHLSQLDSDQVFSIPRGHAASAGDTRGSERNYTPTERPEAKIAALTEYLSATAGTQTRSPGAESHLYELRVREALNEIVSANSGELEMLEDPDSGQRRLRFDALVRVGETPVIIETKNLSSRHSDRVDSRTLNQLRGYLSGFPSPEARALLVTPIALAVDVHQAPQADRIASVRWTSPEDNPALLKALHHLAAD